MKTVPILNLLLLVASAIVSAVVPSKKGQRISDKPREAGAYMMNDSGSVTCTNQGSANDCDVTIGSCTTPVGERSSGVIGTDNNTTISGQATYVFGKRS